MVSDSVLKKIGNKKSIGFGIGNIWYRIRYQKIFGIKKSIGCGIGNIWYWKKSCIQYRKKLSKNLGYVCSKHGFVKFGICIDTGFETFPIFF